MGQARNKGTYEQRVAAAKERTAQLKAELEQIAVEEAKAAKEKEDAVKSLIEFHLKYPQQIQPNGEVYAS